jgi:hypothetical protein
MLQYKYLILIWIIILIIFTFFCIYRLSRISRISRISNNKFDNISMPYATSQNLVDYITMEQSKDKIIDIPGCENVYDDNIGVRSLGYNNCSSAYTDYYHRNLDINQKYGNSNTLAELCPVSTKSDAYMNCMQQLLNKFNTNANILDKINNDMTSVLNKRLVERSDILNNVEIAMNPYLFSKDQQDFRNNMTLGEPINPLPDQVIENVNNYYDSKYGFSKSVFSNINIPHLQNKYVKENFISNLEIYKIDPYIETTFFGAYTPIKGQFLAFNNLTILLNYDTSNTNDSIDNTSTSIKTVKKVLLIIIDNNTNTQIVNRVMNIDFYQQYKNVIKIDLFEQSINSSQPSDSQLLQQLLKTLGITIPNRLIMSVEEFTSTENITRKTYKLMNSGMDTIMIMEKN